MVITFTRPSLIIRVTAAGVIFLSFAYALGVISLVLSIFNASMFKSLTLSFQKNRGELEEPKPRF